MPSKTRRKIARIQNAKRKRAIAKVKQSPEQTTLGLKMINIYLPPSIIRRVKLAAIDRDTMLKMLVDSSDGGALPRDVVPIRGGSGVVAQVLTDYFNDLDAGVEHARRAASGE